MTKKLLLSGYFGFDNSGDDAILKAMVDSLKASGKDYEITALSKDPEKTKKNYDIKSLDRFSVKEVYQAMKATDAFVFGGGSLLQDITSSRSIYYYLALICLGLFLKKPVFVFANGVGPINKRLNRFFTRLVLNRVSFITLRDKASLNFIKALGVKNPKVEVTADPVFLLESASDERAEEVLLEQGISLSNNVLGISIRDWKESPNLAREIAKFCDSLVNEDIDILVVPMHYPYDVEYSETIKVLSKNKRIFVLKNKYEVEDIIAILKRCKLVMAMRLHALIYSAKANIPTIGLIYDPKVTGLIDELSIVEYLRVEEANQYKLRDKYDKAMEKLEDRKKSMGLAKVRQEALSKKTLDFLEEVLNG